MAQLHQTQPADSMTEDQLKKKRELSRKRMLTLESHVFVCNGGCCTKKASAEAVLQQFKEVVDEFSLADRIRISATTGCLGRCADACTVVVYPEGTWYKHVTPEIVQTIIQEDLINGKKQTNHISYTYDKGKFHEYIKEGNGTCP